MFFDGGLASFHTTAPKPSGAIQTQPEPSEVRSFFASALRPSSIKSPAIKPTRSPLVAPPCFTRVSEVISSHLELSRAISSLLFFPQRSLPRRSLAGGGSAALNNSWPRVKVELSQI